MQVVNEKTLARFVRRHPDAADWLENWLTVAFAANWQHIQDVKIVFPAADGSVRVRSGGTVTVFDVCGNRYRMVVSIVYLAQVLTILEVMTHPEYSKNLWKQRY